MKKIIISIFAAVIMTVIPAAAQAQTQNYTRAGNTFAAQKSAGAGTCAQAPEKTKYMYTDTDGKTYPVYIGKTGACYILRVSGRTGKEYRKYLGAEISAEICRELKREYKPRTRK